MPQVTSGPIDATNMDANPQGAQMLDAREYQVGDAARLFGIPGRLMEYSTAGTSLTYQNLSEVWADFVRGCLAPNYLEPIEQALSDLLPRATVARFHRDVLLQSDIKTRFDVYGTAIDKGILTPEQVQVLEGYLPGDIENASVPPAPPAAIPAPIQKRSAESIRCDGMMVKGKRVATCNKLLPPFTGSWTCERCGKTHESSIRSDEPSEMTLLTRQMAEAITAISKQNPVLNITAPLTVKPPDPEPEPVETRMSYDANGRVSRIEEGTKVTRLLYDDDGHLTGIDEADVS